LLAIGALVLLLDRRPVVILGINALLFAAAVVLMWRGQEAGRGMLAGLATGAVPLLFGVCLQGYQYVCHATAVMPQCVAVCSAGGLVAGLLIAWTAQRRAATSTFVLSAGAVALLMGALGCACAGVAGVVGLMAGLTIPIAAGQLRTARQEA
jgi:hypothetical protein